MDIASKAKIEEPQNLHGDITLLTLLIKFNRRQQLLPLLILKELFYLTPVALGT